MAHPRTLRLHATDNVIVAVDPIEAGAVIDGVSARERIPRGHKMAAARSKPSEPVLKFGQIIGFARSAIAPGDWVHEHNCHDARIRARLSLCRRRARRTRCCRSRSRRPSRVFAAPTASSARATISAC